MNPIQVSWLAGILIPSILLLCLGFVFSSLIFRKKENRSFDLRSEFPFELVDAGEPAYRPGRICILLWGLLDAAVAFYLLASISSHSSLLSLSIIYAISTILRNVALVSLFYTPAYRFKPHFLSFVCSCALTGFVGAVGAIICVNVRNVVGSPAIAAAVVLAALGVATLIVMANPKLANWPKLESTMDESGAVVERRPKIFILAFSEWLALFFAMALSIASLVSFIVFDLI